MSNPKVLSPLPRIAAFCLALAAAIHAAPMGAGAMDASQSSDALRQAKADIKLREAGRLYDSARALYTVQQDFKAARYQFLRFASAYPKHQQVAAAEFYAIKCLFDLKMYRKYREEVEALRRQNPNHPALDELDFNVAYSYAKEYQFAKSVEAFEKYAETHSSSPLVEKAGSQQAEAEQFVPPSKRTSRDGKAEDPAGEDAEWLESLLARGRRDVFLKESREFLANRPDAPTSPRIQYLQILSLEEEGRSDEARHKAADFATRFPDSEYAAQFSESNTKSFAHAEFTAGAKDQNYGSTVSKAEAILDANRNSWRSARVIKTLAHRSFTEDTGDNFAWIREAAKAEGISEKERDSFKIMDAVRSIQNGEVDKGRTEIDALVAKHSGTELYQNYLLNTFERWYRQELYGSIEETADAVVRTYGPETREWVTATLFKAIIQFCRQDNEAGLATLESFWQTANCDQPYRNYLKPIAAKWAVVKTAESDLTDARKLWEQRVDELPEGKLKTNLFSGTGK